MNQLEELMVEHKRLAEFYQEDRLAREINVIDEKTQIVLEQEQAMQHRLQHVQETKEKLKQQGVDFSEEAAFLRSEEAKTALRLFEEENTCKNQMFEKTLKRYESEHDRYKELRKKLEAAGINLPDPFKDEEMQYGNGSVDHVNEK
ncbi:hypothetical protein GDO86_014681 [Hymenochirus boettgeri]|uniref:Uncharacterized protein n=1 Tax=Hymenochirus boettgeri TaxID=247094 RepID=A0A8T2JY88_9PIPI|nr:hypothetical protein GDO86_014681 [Hymenochirus boettgeri]